MSVALSGDTNNLTSPLQANVTSTADNGSGAIRVQTAAPHLFGSGDVVEVFTDTSEGTFSITVSDSTHFDLVGSTFTSSGSGEAVDFSLTPQILVPTDGDTFSSQLSGLLSAFQGVMDRTQRLQDEIVTNYNDNAVEWRPGYFPDIVSATWSSIGAVCWDPDQAKWILAGLVTATSHVQIVWGRGGDLNGWHAGSADSLGTNITYVCRGIEPATTPPDKYIYVAGINAGAGDIFRFDTNANVWQNFSLTDNANVTDCKVACISGVLDVFTGASSSADCHIKYSPNSLATLNNIFSFAIPVVGWLVAQTGVGFGRILAISTNANGSNSVSGGLDVYTTTDGVSYTHTNIASGIAANVGETPTTLCWASDYAGFGCWLLSTWDGSTVRMYRAYNPGTTWRLLATNLVTLGSKLASMSAVGKVITAVVFEHPAGRLLYSLDGGILWNLSDSDVINTSAVTPFLQMAQSPNGMIVVSDEIVLVSKTYGFVGGFGTL